MQTTSKNFLKSTVGHTSRQNSFHIEHYGWIRSPLGYRAIVEAIVGYGKYYGVVLCAGLQRRTYFQVILAFYFLRIGPWVVDVDGWGVLTEGRCDVGNLCVAYIGAVFFEGEAEDEDAGV